MENISEKLDSISAKRIQLQDKYTFFLMAAVGAAIAFILRSEPCLNSLQEQLIFIGTLVFLSSSFLIGCLFINSMLKYMTGNYNAIAAPNEEAKNHAVGKMNFYNKWNVIYWKWQFIVFLIGFCLFFIHVIMRYL